MVSDYTAYMEYMDPAVPRKAVKFNPSLSHSLTCMVSADSSVSVIDYHKVSNIRHTKSQNLNASRLIL